VRRRFNYTNRARIRHQDVRLSITEDDSGRHKFHADLNLNHLSLPADGRVWVEAFDANAFMRFPFGTVAVPYPETDTTLDTFAGTDSYSFRVKVVDPGNHARLLARSAGISPVREDPEGGARKSLLRVSTRDLGHLPWKLEFQIGDYPLLVINNEIDAGKSLARSNHFFQALVFPAVLETILRRILMEDEEYMPGNDEEEEEDAWKEAWLEFAGTLPGNSRLPPNEELDREQREFWIEESVAVFSRHIGAVRKVRVELKEIE
jgi:hypothetical protein